jgi:hypothetical protein
MYIFIGVIIPVVEDIEKARKPFPNMEAIYFVVPDEKNVALIIGDFGKSGRLYHSCHLYFSEGHRITDSRHTNAISAACFHFNRDCTYLNKVKFIFLCSVP